MNHYTYILFSESLEVYYKGHTKDIESRLERHNKGYVNYTSKGIPWRLILSIKKKSNAEAMTLEKKLKNLNRIRLEAFIEKYK